MEEKPQHYSFSIDKSLFDEIEDYRFSNRFPSRRAAVLDLIRKGLESVAELDAGSAGGDK